MFIYVNVMGEIWKLKRAEWLTFLMVRGSGDDPDIGDYGRPLGTIQNATDLTPAAAKDLFDQLTKRK